MYENICGCLATPESSAWISFGERNVGSGVGIPAEGVSVRAA